MMDSAPDILDSSLTCCLKCKGLFKTSEEDHDKHVITCSGNPFKSPTSYFACERKIFLQLFQPEDFQLDGSFNLLNISKDDSFLNQVVKIRLPQETIDPLFFLRNYTSTVTETLPESGLDLLDENIADLETEAGKDATLVGDHKSAYNGTNEDYQIQNIINKNLDYLKPDGITNLHPTDAKEPFVQPQGFLPESNVGYSGDALNYASSQPVPFTCNLSSDLLSDLSASHDQNQPTIGASCSTLQHLELPKKDPFLGQAPSLTQLNSKDPFLINATVRSGKSMVTGPKNMPMFSKSIYDIQTSPTFQLQDGNYFAFPSMLDEPTQLDYLDLATLDFLTNPNFNYGPKEKDDFCSEENLTWLDSNTTSLTLDSFEKFDKNATLPTKTRDDSAVDRKMKRIRLDKVKTQFPKKSKMYFSKPNVKSKSNENSPRNRRHSAREGDKTVTKASPTRSHTIGQSKEAPEKITEKPKSSTRKRKLSLPSTLEIVPNEGQTKVKNERKFCGKSRLCLSGETFNVKETLAGFSEEEKDSFKAVLGKNACVLVKKQKLMPYFKPPVIEQVNAIMANNLKSFDTENLQKSKTTEQETFIKSQRKIDNITDFHIRCPTCVYKCNTVNELKKHHCSELSSSLKRQFMFTCFQCEFTCESVTVLAEHVQVQHTVKDIYKHVEKSCDNVENIQHYVTGLSKANLTDLVHQQETAQVPKRTELTINGNPVATTIYKTSPFSGNKRDIFKDCKFSTNEGSSLTDKQEAVPVFETSQNALQNVCTVCHNKNLKLCANTGFGELYQKETEQSERVVFRDIPDRPLPECLEEISCHMDKSSMFYGQDIEQDLKIDSYREQIIRNSVPEYLRRQENSDNLNEKDCVQYTAIKSDTISGNIIDPASVENWVYDTSTDMVNIKVHLIEKSLEESGDKDHNVQTAMKEIGSNENRNYVTTVKTDENKMFPFTDITLKCGESTVDNNQSLCDTIEQPAVGTIEISTPGLKLGETNRECKGTVTEINTISSKNTVDQCVFSQNNNQRDSCDAKKVKNQLSCIQSVFSDVEDSSFDIATSEPTLQQDCESNRMKNDASDLNTTSAESELLEDHMGSTTMDNLMVDTQEPLEEKQKSLDNIAVHKSVSTGIETCESLINKSDAECLETELKDHSKDAMDQERLDTCNIKDVSTGCFQNEHSYCKNSSTEPKDVLTETKEGMTKITKDDGYWYCSVQDCDFRTLYKRNLTVHKMKHDGVKRFLCDKCPYSTPDATCLSSHQKHNHSDEIRFKCTDCDFTSIMRIEILRHYRNIHLQQKIYACNQCEYRTGYTYLLKFHLMSHAGIKPFKCSLCDYQVCNSTKVMRHIKTVHIGQKEAKCIKLDLTFEIDAKQFKCAEPVSEKDIKVIELTDEEIKVYSEKRRRQAKLKKEEKERKEKARIGRMHNKKIVKPKSVKMVSLLGNIMDTRKEQDDNVKGQPVEH